MTETESLQSHRPQSTFTTWLGVVLLFAFFGLLALVVVRAAPRGTTYEKKRAQVRAKKFEDAQKEYFTALTTYGWVDKTKGIAHIPVTDAMKLTVAELAEKKPTAAGPIAAESPAPAAGTSPAASPAPNASASPAASPAASASATPKVTSVEGKDSEARNQPAAAANPPAAAPKTQPGPSTSPAASAPSQPAKAQVSPAPSVAPTAPGTPLPVRGKTP